MWFEALKIQDRNAKGYSAAGDGEHRPVRGVPAYATGNFFTKLGCPTAGTNYGTAVAADAARRFQYSDSP